MLYGEVFADDIDPPCGIPGKDPCKTGMMYERASFVEFGGNLLWFGFVCVHNTIPNRANHSQARIGVENETQNRFSIHCFSRP